MAFDPRYLAHSFRPGAVRVGSGAEVDDLAYFDSKAPRRSGGGAPILLLHGFTADKETWLSLARRLGRRHRLVAPDLAGHGGSGEAADGDYGIVRQAERARALVESLTPPLGRHHVLGHSMGGAVAAEYAIRNASEALSLGLISPAVAKPTHTEEFHEQIARCINPLIVSPGWRGIDKIRFVTRGPWWLHGLLALLGPSLTRRGLARRALYEEIFAQLAPEIRKPPGCSSEERPETRRPARERPSYAEGDFSGIRCPTFLLWGTDDRVLNPNLGYIASRMDPEIPTRIELWRKTGHSPGVERPGRTAKAYLSFLEELEA